MRFLLASHNSHKAEEIREILGPGVEIITMKELGDFQELPETGKTLEENALQKARTASQRHEIEGCIADDTGLEVDFLNGAPGVYSARYAGPRCSSDDNIEKLLKEMKESSNRRARFRTVIALIIKGKEYTFEGEVVGTILHEREGESGFGYDPIFRPEESERSFASMSNEEKNRISHRGRAIQKLNEFLVSQRHF